MSPDSSSPEKKRTNLPEWINLPNLVFLGVILFFSGLILWSESLSRYFSGIKLADIQIKPTATILPGTPTMLPFEWYATTEQTNGIILGGIVLMVIILFGCIGIMLRDRKRDKTN